MNDDERTAASPLPEGELEAAPPLPPQAPARYRMQQLIAVGGMGVVYEAQDLLLGHRVAFKTLQARFRELPGLRERLHQEARLTARLQHPTILPVYDLGYLSDGMPFYTMKLAPGQTLSGRLEQGGTLRTRLDLLLRVAEGVAYAHDQGVVHRDLKPANVRLGAFGEVYVLDWGLARHVAEVSDAAGTPGFMAPEQSSGSSPQPHLDVWALGVMLRLALGGSRDQEQLPAGVDDVLVQLVARAHAPNPQDRLPDGRAFVSALRAWLEDAERRERALQRVQAGQAILPEVDARRSQARALRQEAEQGLRALPAYAPTDQKGPWWSLQDQAKALSREADLREVEALQLLRGALTIHVELPEAHEALALYTRDRHAEAEERGDEDEAAKLELLLRSHNRGEHDQYLRGEGVWRLRVHPPQAQVTLYREQLLGRRLQPTFLRTLPPAETYEQVLPMGSYRAKVEAPGFATVWAPFVLGRGGVWDDLAPGESTPRALRLPALQALREDDLFVPAGWTQVGGDPLAIAGWPAQRVWVEDFVVRRLPVTNAEYLAFLNDLAAQGPVDPELPPRERPAVEGRYGELLYRWDGERFSLETDPGGPGWRADWPVMNVSWFGAQAYARWLAQRDGLPWRLLTELEYEKAARGVDARLFPCGPYLDPTWTRTRSTAASVEPAGVREHLGDESPYGVLGLAGNMRTWCSDAESGGRRAARGGAWSYPPESCRPANRMAHTPDTRVQNLGLRVARGGGW